MRQVDQAVTYFKQLGTVDPYRLDNLDTYSNLLYVKEQRVELAHLAHRFLASQDALEVMLVSESVTLLNQLD